MTMTKETLRNIIGHDDSYSIDDNGGPDYLDTLKAALAVLDRCVVIDRADLPEVRDAENNLGVYVEDAYYGGFSVAHLRERAMAYLAVAEHIEAHESEAQAKEAVLTKRRDELVASAPHGECYRNYEHFKRMTKVGANVIDLLIVEQDKVAALEARLAGEHA